MQKTLFDIEEQDQRPKVRRPKCGSQNPIVFHDYESFIAKFTDRPKTTEECYTPRDVYEAVVKYVGTVVDLSDKEILRPFYPGGDYENAEYPEDGIVIDNPPFSMYTDTRAREGDFRTLGTFGNVRLSDGDMERLRMRLAEEGRDDAFLNRCIEKLSAFMAQEGRTYQNHAAAILAWVKNAVAEDDLKTGTSRQAQQQAANDNDTQLRQMWQSLTPEEQKNHLDLHGGLYPWQDPQYTNSNGQHQ